MPIFAQKQFTIKIELPVAINLALLDISYDNGKIREQTVDVKKHAVTIKDSLYAKFAAIFVSYKVSGEGSATEYITKTFWVTNANAFIKFKNISSSSIETDNNKSKNILLVDSLGQDKMNKFTEPEGKAIRKFLTTYADSLRTNQLFFDELQRLFGEDRRKELEFIAANPTLYYSFWSFRRDIAPSTKFSTDSLFQLFYTLFPDSSRNSLEGKQILKILNSRRNVVTGNMAPGFISKNTKGNFISLHSLKGKYVLLDFWATWCKPCLETTPVLRWAHEYYPSQKFQLLSISLDKNKDHFKKAIVQHKMEWMHIFSDRDLVTDYNVGAIPQLLLINPEGKIIFNLNDEASYNNESLKKMLLEKIQ